MPRLLTQYKELGAHKQLILLGVAGALFGLVLSLCSSCFFSLERWTSFALMIPFALLVAAPPLYAWARKTLDVFEPVYLFLVLYAFLYLVKPFVQLIRREPFIMDGAYLNQALLLAMLGLVCFYVGYYTGVARWVAAKIPTITREISSRKLVIAAWGLILLGFWGLNHYIQTSGGWGVFWQQAHGYGGKALKTTAYIYQLPELMVIGFLLVCEAFLHSKIVEKTRVTLSRIALLLAAALGGVGIYTVIWGSRTLYSWLIIAIAIFYFMKRGTRPKLRTVFLTIVALFFLLALVPLYRAHMHLGSDLTKIFSSVSWDTIAASLSSNTDEFNSYLAEVSLVPNSVPYDYFGIYVRTLAHPIPRLIWPSKPALFNAQWDTFLAKSGLQWGAAESFLGDLYAQLGTWGIILGTFFAGLFWRTLYEWYKKTPRNRATIFLYALILPNMFTFLAQSTLIAFLKWLPYMVPGAIVALLIARVRRSNDPSDRSSAAGHE
jgi:oligosaccharide repeat unit polymerase